MQRSGSTTTVFVLDVSRSMGKLVRDPGDGTSAEPDDSLPPVQKLVWAKEYLNRKLVQLVSSRAGLSVTRRSDGWVMLISPTSASLRL